MLEIGGVPPSPMAADDEEDRAPICPSCGVTALPSELDQGFVCENPDCPAYGDEIEAGG